MRIEFHVNLYYTSLLKHLSLKQMLHGAIVDEIVSISDIDSSVNNLNPVFGVWIVSGFALPHFVTVSFRGFGYILRVY